MRRYAIINPSSGNGTTGRHLDGITRALKEIAAEISVSKHPGHCRELARNTGAFDEIVAVGGDGTVYEILQTIDLTRQTLVLIPSGTGNSLARDLRLKNFRQGILSVNTGRLRRIDILSIEVTRADATVERLRSASTIAFGYVVRCTKLCNNGFKRLGRFSYPVAAMLCAAAKRMFDVQLNYGEGTVQKRQLSGLLISNTRHAANFEVFPHALTNDNIFDIMEIDAGFFRQSLHNVSILSGRHFYSPVDFHRTDSLHVRPDSPLDLLIDGELLPDVVDIRISILPEKLQCYSAG